VFPQIKASGCCHEVFHTQKLLYCVLHEILELPQPDRSEIYTDVSGINHFTWFTKAYYKDIDLMALLPQFIEKYFDSGYYENGPADQYKTDMFAYANNQPLCSTLSFDDARTLFNTMIKNTAA
jgi:galacturan 1,4-alpha-galacturonidase